MARKFHIKITWDIRDVTEIGCLMCIALKWLRGNAEWQAL